MDITGKLWSFCNKLRHDGVDPSDYIEQLSYLLFLKIASERKIFVPTSFNWESLISKDESSILPHLENILENLKKERGILGDIFSEPVSRVKNPKILQELTREINSIEWMKYDGDVVGIAFEELIGKVANEGKKGAGQYFTPRPVIQAIVQVIKPNPLEKSDFSIGDVAAGTAGFLIVAYEWFKKNFSINQLSERDKERIINNTYFGQELVQRPRRLALMNMFLHGINAKIKLGDSIYSSSDISYSCILSNPPFGNKGANQIPPRQFPVKTSDKQLNFVQHIIEKLEVGGRAAIVLPDGSLFNENARKLWSFYLNKEKSGENCCNIHTILKLPEGTFAAYANGVKACVVFLQKGALFSKLWVHDSRKNLKKITTKSNILKPEHFEDFIHSYGDNANGLSKRVETDRFKAYNYNKIVERDFDLSFSEISEQEPLPPPALIINEMIADFQRKIKALKELKKKLS